MGADQSAKFLAYLGDREPPGPDRLWRHVHDAAEIVYHVYRWTCFMGLPPRPEDWDGRDGWPSLELVEAVFDDWNKMITVSGVMDAAVGETLSGLAEVLVKSRRAVEERERALKARERQAEKRVERAQARATDFKRQLQTQKEKADDAESRAREAAREAEQLNERVVSLQAQLEEQRQTAARVLPRLGKLVQARLMTASAEQRDAIRDAWARQISSGALAERVAAGATGQISPTLRISETPHRDGQLWHAQWVQPLETHRATVTHDLVLADDADTLQVGAWSTARGTDGRLCRDLELGVLTPWANAAVNAAGCRDGNWPLTDEPLILEVHDIPRAAAFLRSDDRRLAVVAVTPTSEGELEVATHVLAKTLCGLAHVWEIDHRATFALTDAMGRQLSCWGGAVRVYFPGLEDEGWFYPPTSVKRIEAGEGLSEALRRRLESAAAAALLPPDDLLWPEHTPTVVAAPPSSNEASEKIALLERQLHKVTEQLQRAHEHEHAQQRTIASLKRTIGELQHLNRPSKADAHPQDVEDQEPSTVLEAVQMAEARCRHLRFAPAAFASAEETPYRRPKQVLTALLTLDDLAEMYGSEDGIGGRMADQARALGLDWSSGVSQTAKGRRGGHKYQIQYEGQPLELGPHVRLGNANGADMVARIYVGLVDGERRQMVVGHVGKHLPDSTTKF